MAENNEDVSGIVEEIYEASAEEKIRWACEAREKYEWDMASSRELGREEGREEGREAALRDLAIKKAKKGKSIEQIAEDIDCSVEQVKNWIEK